MFGAGRPVPKSSRRCWDRSDKPFKISTFYPAILVSCLQRDCQRIADARSDAAPLEPAMGWLPAGRLLSGILILFLACGVFSVCSRAQSPNLAGQYQCVQVKAKGKVTSCSSAPLTLKHDGHFELRGWEGSYLVNGSWVELSDSTLKTRAKIEPGHRIVLRYYGKDGLVEMVYERRIAELGKTALS